MQAKEFVEKCRSFYPNLPDSELLTKVKCIKDLRELDNEYDINEQFRESICEELNKDISVADRELAKFLMRQEIECNDGGWGTNINIQLCALMLYKIGHIEDTLLIWEAKTVNMDTFCALNVQFLVGAGVDATISFLRNSDHTEAREELDFIEQCQITNDFVNLDKFFNEMESYLGKKN